MRQISHNPTWRTESIPMGVYSWTDAHGESQSAEFVITAPADDGADDGGIVSWYRQSAYNLQAAALEMSLELQGCRDITFREYRPCCIF